MGPRRDRGRGHASRAVALEQADKRSAGEIAGLVAEEDAVQTLTPNSLPTSTRRAPKDQLSDYLDGAWLDARDGSVGASSKRRGRRPRRPADIMRPPIVETALEGVKMVG